MMTCRIIFLDIDGVLHTSSYDDLLSLIGYRRQDEFGAIFSPRSVRNLSRIVKHTGAHIVLSLNWRHWGSAKVTEMWASRNLPGKLLGVTPRILDKEIGERGKEIQQWLKENHLENTKYVIFDDRDDFLPEQKKCFIKTNYRIGILLIDVLRAVRILKDKS